MTGNPDEPAVEPPAALAHLRHVPATTAVLPAPTPKPTSRSGQHETTLAVWDSQAIATGVWECEPGEFTADRSQQTEICTVLSGSATVTGVGGEVAHVRSGSLLVLPAGWRGTWLIEETLRKTYVLIAAGSAL